MRGSKGGSKELCSPKDIRIYQWQSGYTGIHVPKFTVQIINEAWRANAVYGVEISCGPFASTGLINPFIFRRTTSNNCLLKNGRKINPGEVVSFHYSNILPYTFNVLEVKC